MKVSKLTPNPMLMTVNGHLVVSNTTVEHAGFDYVVLHFWPDCKFNNCNN